MAMSEQGQKEPAAGSVKKPIVDLSLSEFLRKSVEVLCGKRDPELVYEKQLRLFQFKAWLLSSGRNDVIVRTAGMTYAAAMIARKTRLLRKKYPNEERSSLLIKALKHSGYCSLYNFTFISPRTVYSLTESPSFALLSKDVNEKQKYILDLNELTLLRLRIASTEGLNCTLKDAYNAYDAVRAYEAELLMQRGIKPNLKNHKYSSGSIRTAHEERESREPFLFVAFRYSPEIAELSPNEKDMLKLLDKQVQDPTLFQDFFGRCQTVVSLLEIASLSSGSLKSWSGTNSILLDDISPISEEDQIWLGVKDEARRKVEETAKAVRQRPR